LDFYVSVMTSWSLQYENQISEQAVSKEFVLKCKYVPQFIIYILILDTLHALKNIIKSECSRQSRSMRDIF